MAALTNDARWQLAHVTARAAGLLGALHQWRQLLVFARMLGHQHHGNGAHVCPEQHTCVVRWQHHSMECSAASEQLKDGFWTTSLRQNFRLWKWPCSVPISSPESILVIFEPEIAPNNQITS